MAIRVTQADFIGEVPTLAASKMRITQAALIFEVPTIPTPFTYPISLPVITGIGPKDFTLNLKNIVGEADSPFTASEQVQLWPGDMFVAEVNLPPMLYQQAEQWISALAMLLGKYGTFLMGDWNRPTPQGAMSGSPVVSGTALSGQNYINLRALTPSIANWAVAGDYIQVTAPGGPQRIYKVLQNAASTSGGTTELAIRPNIREQLSDGTAIVTSNCMGTFRLSSNETPWKIDENRVYTISFKAREAQLP